MIKQKKNKKHFQIKIEPWQHQQIVYDIDSPTIQDNQQLITSQIVPQSKHQNITIKINSPKNKSNNKQHQITNKSRYGINSCRTPGSLSIKSKKSQTINYINENQKNLKIYARRLSTANPQTDTLSPNNRIIYQRMIKKPKINITHIGYSEDLTQYFEYHHQNQTDTIQKQKSRKKSQRDQQQQKIDKLENNRLKKSRPNTGYSITKPNLPSRQPTTRLDNYRASNHLQKVLKIKQKLRNKNKYTNIPQKNSQFPEVFLFKDCVNMKDYKDQRKKIQMKQKIQYKTKQRKLSLRATTPTYKNQIQIRIDKGKTRNYSLIIQGGSIPI